MKYPLLLLAIIHLAGCAPPPPPSWNLDLENYAGGERLPEGWSALGEATVSVDDRAYRGDRAVRISADSTAGQAGAVFYRIPGSYSGDTLTLTAYVRTEGVKNGFAGLVLRVDAEGEWLAGVGMEDRGITGDTDWQPYRLSIPYPTRGDLIAFGGMLTGGGQAWFDEFSLALDGQDLATLDTIVLPPAPAELDLANDNGSGLTVEELSTCTPAELALLGRVWGFLKYHHPSVKAGAFNWDYELFRFLPFFLRQREASARRQALAGWVAKYGRPVPCRACIPPDTTAYLPPDHAWLDELDADLQNQLRYIAANAGMGPQYYVRMAPNVGNPEFTHENDYAFPAYPDAGFRLLALYRYWNMIHYFFPYRELMDEDWNEQLEAFVPAFLAAENEFAYELAVTRLIARVQDTHATLYRGADRIAERRGDGYPPLDLDFVEGELVVAEFYDSTLQNLTVLRVGDVITSVDGTPVDQLVDSMRPYYPASNEPTRLRNIAGAILQTHAESVDVTYRGADGYERSTPLLLYSREKVHPYGNIKPYRGPAYRKLADDIGYITLQTIQPADIDSIKQAFADTRGIIIDIRNYPATFVPFLLGSWFVREPTPFAKSTVGSTLHPGQFLVSDPLEISPTDTTYTGTVVVLVNELTQSQAEYTTMALQAGVNTTVIGSTTAGADGNVSEIALPGGLYTRISGIGILYPDGRETQRIGIVPDLTVRRTLAGVRAGRDELLDRAVDLIRRRATE